MIPGNLKLTEEVSPDKSTQKVHDDTNECSNAYHE
jgi:hypothetical protein